MVRIILFLAAFSLIGEPSAEARKLPKQLSARQIDVAKEIITYLKENHPAEDPLEYIAIAWVESGLTKTAISRTGDYGVLQVNYRINKKKLNKNLGINSRKELMELENNIDASVLIMNILRRKYRHCRGNKTYSCYNGGPGWKRVQERCLKDCSDSCRKCKRAARYGKLTNSMKRYLKRKYISLFTAPKI